MCKETGSSEKFQPVEQELIVGSQLDMFVSRDEKKTLLLDFAKKELLLVYGLYITFFQDQLAEVIKKNTDIKTDLGSEQVIEEFKKKYISVWNEEFVAFTYKILRETQKKLLLKHGDQLSS